MLNLYLVGYYYVIAHDIISAIKLYEDSCEGINVVHEIKFITNDVLVDGYKTKWGDTDEKEKT